MPILGDASKSYKMTAEQLLKHTANNPDLLVLSGSRLYGTYLPTSDEDFRGFFMPPWEYLTTRTCNEIDIAKPPIGDHKVYTLGAFITGLLKSDTQMLELLFAPITHHVCFTPLAKELITNRQRFVAKSFYWRITGFSNSEYRKALGVKVVIPDRTKTEDDVITDIRNVFSPDKSDMDQIITLLNAKKKYEKIPSLQGVGIKRRKEFESYGYTASSACHSLRLLLQCRELLDTGTITFPCPEAAMLSDIKRGKMPLPEIEERYAESKAKCDEAFATSKLREKPDAAWASEWYETQVAKSLANDKRMTERAMET